MMLCESMVFLTVPIEQFYAQFTVEAWQVAERDIAVMVKAGFRLDEDKGSVLASKRTASSAFVTENEE